MEFTIDDIKKAAHDVRIEVDQDDIKAIREELSARLKLIMQLQDVNTEGIEPMVNPLPHNMELRKDIATEGSQEQSLMAACKNTKYNYFLVPKVRDE